MTHVARARRPRGKGLRSKAAKARKAGLFKRPPLLPTRHHHEEN